MYGYETNYLIRLHSKTSKKPAENLPKPALRRLNIKTYRSAVSILYDRIPDWNK